MLKIPKSHIVEIDFITGDTIEKKSKLLRGLIGLAVTAVGMATPLALVSAPVTLIAKSLVLFKEVLFVGAGVGALTGIGTKTVKENFCIISYLDENAPKDLKLIVLDANASVGNSFVKDRQNFVEKLQTQIRRSTKKADCVKAFMLELEKELEAQEKDGITTLNIQEDLQEESLQENVSSGLHTKFVARIHAYTPSEGGSNLPLSEGKYKLSFNAVTIVGNISGSILLMPGEEDLLDVELSAPLLLNEGDRFDITDELRSGRHANKGYGIIDFFVE